MGSERCSRPYILKQLEERTMPLEYGHVLGRFASDGYVGGHSVQWYCAQLEFDVRDYLFEVLSRAWDVKVYRDKRSVVDVLTVNSVDLTRYFRALNLKMVVPDMEGDVLLGYLAGLFDGDGHVAQKTAVLTIGRNKKLFAREVEEILNNLGVGCTLRHYQYPGREESHIRIRRPYVDKFQELIGFLSRYKKEKMTWQ